MDANRDEYVYEEEDADMVGSGEEEEFDDSPAEFTQAHAWMAIDAYFKEKGLVRQQLDSFDYFINTRYAARRGRALRVPSWKRLSTVAVDIVCEMLCSGHLGCVGDAVSVLTRGSLQEIVEDTPPIKVTPTVQYGPGASRSDVRGIPVVVVRSGFHVRAAP